MPRSIREIAIVLILIGAGLVIIFSGARGRENGIESRVLFMLARPFQQIAATVQSRLAATWQSYLNLVNVKAENRALRNEVRRLVAERTRLLNEESENRRLKKLFDFKAQYEFPSLIAQVIGEDSVGWYRSFFVNRGSYDG